MFIQYIYLVTDFYASNQVSMFYQDCLKLPIKCIDTNVFEGIGDLTLKPGKLPHGCVVWGVGRNLTPFSLCSSILFDLILQAIGFRGITHSDAARLVTVDTMTLQHAFTPRMRSPSKNRMTNLFTSPKLFSTLPLFTLFSLLNKRTEL